MEKCIYYLTVIDNSSRVSEANSVDIKKQIVITSEKRLKHTDIRKISNYIISYTSTPMGLCPDVPILSFEGDVIVGRTSEEKANELVEDHNAEIISPEEAISLLEENKSLVGEFKKTADGDNSFNWYAVEKAKTKL